MRLSHTSTAVWLVSFLRLHAFSRPIAHHIPLPSVAQPHGAAKDISSTSLPDFSLACFMYLSRGSWQKSLSRLVGRGERAYCTEHSPPWSVQVQSPADTGSKLVKTMRTRITCRNHVWCFKRALVAAAAAARSCRHLSHASLMQAQASRCQRELSTGRASIAGSSPP